MSKEFLYDVTGMKDVSSDLQAITSNIHQLSVTINSAKNSITNMESLGFLDTKYIRVEQIETNLLDSILTGIEDYQMMISKNAADVAGTDNQLASQIEGASK